MTEADLDAVATTARLGFPDHFEGRDIFANRLALFPRGCFTLARSDGKLLGYPVAYPWVSDSAPALNESLRTLPADATVMYLHDLALLPEARGFGFGREMITTLAEQARAEGWAAISLVAVNNAASYWKRQGFVSSQRPEIHEHLVSYGEAACHMTRLLTG